MRRAIERKVKSVVERWKSLCRMQRKTSAPSLMTSRERRVFEVAVRNLDKFRPGVQQVAPYARREFTRSDV